MKALILFSLSLILITSCSPERRLHRLVTKHPELLRIDTIRISDTTIISEIRIDTAFHHSSFKDTVIITKEKLKLQLIEINDTIYMNVYQEPDTIIITKEIPVERIIHIETENWVKKLWNDFKVNIFCLVLLIILFICLSVFLRGRKR